jgi:SAM-dependent methyltransferase
MLNKMEERIHPELREVARFYDARQVGSSGPLGFRRTSELGKLLACLPSLAQAGLLIPDQSRFLDLGCGDGRVNVLFSYLTEVSAGVEQDQWTLDEYLPLKRELDARQDDLKLTRPPGNIRLFCGDSTSQPVHDAIRESVGLELSDFDLFYAFVAGPDPLAELVATRGKPGSVYLVYSMNRIFPRYPGLRLVEDLSPLNDVLAVYQK